MHRSSGTAKAKPIKCCIPRWSSSRLACVNCLLSLHLATLCSKSFLAGRLSSNSSCRAKNLSDYMNTHAEAETWRHAKACTNMTITNTDLFAFGKSIRQATGKNFCAWTHAHTKCLSLLVVVSVCLTACKRTCMNTYVRAYVHIYIYIWNAEGKRAEKTNCSSVQVEENMRKTIRKRGTNVRTS